MKRTTLSNLILGFCLLVAFLVVGGVNFEWSQNRYYPFYHWQAEAFSRGEAHLPVPEDFYHDVIPFEGRKYLALPPLNGVILLPIIALGGHNASERLVFFIFFIAYATLFRKWLNREKPGLSAVDEFWWMLFFCLGTPLIISAGRGTAWFSATLTGSFFLALGLYLFQYSEKKYGKMAGLFAVVVACLSRWHFALMIPILTAILLRERPMRWAVAIFSPKNLLSKWKALIPGLTFTFLFLVWNYWRFGDFFDLHYKNHGYGGFFQDQIAKYGMTNIHYVSTHIYHGLIAVPKFIFETPFLQFDQQGNGILAMSPLFLFMIFKFPKLNREIGTALFMMIALMIPVFTHFSTGWSQHGYRYALDFMPFLFLFLVRGNFSIRSPLAVTLILLSVWMNVTASLTLNM